METLTVLQVCLTSTFWNRTAAPAFTTGPSLRSAMKIMLELLDNISFRVHPSFYFLGGFPLKSFLHLCETVLWKHKDLCEPCSRSCLQRKPVGVKRLAFPLGWHDSATTPANVSLAGLFHRRAEAFALLRRSKSANAAALFAISKTCDLVLTTAFWGGNFHLCKVGGRESGACQTRGLYNLAA